LSIVSPQRRDDSHFREFSAPDESPRLAASSFTTAAEKPFQLTPKNGDRDNQRSQRRFPGGALQHLEVQAD
jgi:hypothetical protein